MKPESKVAQPGAASERAIGELQGIRGELRAIYRLLDDFFRVYLNLRFPHGKATDKWGRRG